MKTKLFLSSLLLPWISLSQNVETLIFFPPDSSYTNKLFMLGEVTITTQSSTEISERLNINKLNEMNRLDVSSGLNLIPGINLTASGARNESMVTVRGFDLRQVPVYMDGIPVYVPYDGYVDLARFTTFDLAAIDVSKGFSSIVYGPNSLGGAINLISRKPSKKFEFDGSLGTINTNGYRGNINIGSKLGKFYFQGGYSYLHRDSYFLSSTFDSTKNEDGGARDNSYRTDQKINFKIGWTPNAKHEYVIGYINQRGEKGTPVYCGNDSLNSMLKKPRYWQWPTWNKETLYFISNTTIGSKSSIKSRIYRDAFKNSVFSYDDATYSTQSKPYAFQSYYNDYTYGGSLEFQTKLLPKNDIKVAVHYKDDIHRENNLGEPVRTFKDNTITAGVEDVYRVTKKFTVVPGISFSSRKNLRAEDFNSSNQIISDYPSSGTSYAFNGQIGLYYNLNANDKLGGSFSHRTRFATIKDRYSYRMGTAIPNPDLNPEIADSYELNYSGEFFKKVTFQTAFFYSKISDAILNVSNVQAGKSQMQNAGTAEYIGTEVMLSYNPFKNMKVGVNYTYIERHNLTNPDVLFTGVPDHKVFGFVQYQPIKRLRVLVSSEYNSSRYSTSYGTQTNGYNLLNSMVSVKVWKYISIDAGVTNILDRNYSLVEGYPEEGRNFFLTVRFFNNN